MNKLVLQQQLFRILLFLPTIAQFAVTSKLPFARGKGGERKYDISLTTAAIEYINPKYIGPDAFIKVSRKSRGSPPALYAFFPILRDLEDINATYTGLQKLDNKWKETLVRINWDFCETLPAKSHLHHVMLDRSSFPSACPIKKGNYTINDFKFDHPYLPPVAVPGSKEWRVKSNWAAEREGEITMTTFWFEFRIDRSKQGLHA